MNNYLFRIDDVSINTDYVKVSRMVDHVFAKYKTAKIILGVSHLVSEIVDEDKKERIFPEIWNALSDHTVFYHVDKCGSPTKLLDGLKDKYGDSIILASHGLIHVDHRLLSEDAQEMSIVASCSLVKSNVFVPPFNKWNETTKSICERRQIVLIQFESGWKHLLYQKINGPGLYFHSRDFDNDTKLKEVL